MEPLGLETLKYVSTFELDSIYLNFLIKGGGGIKLKAYGSGQKEG